MNARLLALFLGLIASQVQAHDTWFQQVGRSDDAALLRLGTGDKFPSQEFSLDASHLARSGCVSADGRPVKLVPMRKLPTALLLRSAGAAPASCWAELVAFDIRIADDKVEVYLDEIAAPPEIRRTWSALKARGIKWTERYRKHARIDLQPMSTALVTGLGLEISMVSQDDASRTFRVSHLGKPLQDFPVELRGERTTDASWHRSDRDGLLRIPAPAAGRWLLRGTHLRPSTERPGTWESDFVTLAFDTGPGPAPAPPSHL